MAGAHRRASQAEPVVGIIADALNSEVCSIYLLRDGVLELFATRGLNQEAVHVTTLALGEGLVGTIAKNVEMLNLDEAAAHPDFAYRPETGEELFHSFAGVPSSAANAPSACSASSMPSRAAMRRSRSRRCRRWRWCCPN